MQMRARFPVLCPARLPRATLGFRLGAPPPRLRADVVGDARRPATGWPADGFAWANHTWFYWREQGVPYAASLHYFGRKETLALLAPLIRELRPANAFR